MPAFHYIMALGFILVGSLAFADAVLTTNLTAHLLAFFSAVNALVFFAQGINSRSRRLRS